MITNNSSQLVSKEHLQYLKFTKEETLTSKRKRSLRAYYLERAAQLGNLLKNKVRIYFINNKNELMHVNTTIWAVTTDFVILKKGVTIPKSSIVYVD